MAGFTTEQWIVIALILLIGLLAGAMLGSGGKWKGRYREERARYNEEHERYLALERGNDARVTAANERIAELERSSPGIGAGTGAAIAGATRGNDDLARIRGIDGGTEVRLNEMGFHRFRQIARLSDDESARIEGQLGAEPGRIERERWREQAEMLVAGRAEEHGQEYGGDRWRNEENVISEAPPGRRRAWLWGRDRERR